MRQHWHTWIIQSGMDLISSLSEDELTKMMPIVQAEDPVIASLFTVERHWVLYQNKLTYFVEKGLEQFLEKLSAKINIEDLNIPDGTVRSISWHPSTKIPPCLLLKKDGYLSLFVLDGYKNGTLAMSLETTTKPTKEDSSYMWMAYGFLIYTHAHPDMVSTDWPDDMKERCARMLRNDGVRGKYIRMTDTIRISPSAHWRNGFYRLYKDDRFVNLKGQIRWVEGCDVSGHGATVDVA